MEVYLHLPRYFECKCNENLLIFFLRYYEKDVSKGKLFNTEDVGGVGKDFK